MDRVLLIEDSAFVLKPVESAFGANKNLEVIRASSLEEARAAVDAAGGDITAALVDLRLPDAADGEAADFTLQRKIPTVIFTSNFDEETRERYLSNGALDVVPKDNPTSLEYLVRLVKRIIRNRETEVLVVDGSTASRRGAVELLQRYKLIVHTARSGEEALQMLADNDAIRLLLTDYEIPGMNGFDLATKARQIYGVDRLAIIGISAAGGAPLSAKFIKHGANDFILKPYLHEELYTRIAQNLDALDYIEKLINAATKDFLTGLYNRRTFFDMGGRIVSACCRDQKEFAVVMMDIDHFKGVNDTWGHDMGDVVLKSIAKVVGNHVCRGGDLCARLGGEEFALVLESPDRGKTFEFVDRLRASVEAAVITLDELTLSVTASFGIAFSDLPELEPALNLADKALYTAKRTGRNKVCIST